MFVDERNIIVEAGNGGDGVVHWRREKFIPKGGPDGGNGGSGGDLYLVSVRDVNILNKYPEGKLFKAEDGDSGGGALRTGKNGKDLFVRVPIGTVVKNLNTDEVFELLEEDLKILIASGGKGGLGNTHFKSSTNTTPNERTLGGRAQKYELSLNLNLIADVGIVGLPNAGKSTLLNFLTNSHSKVGDYPFTTIEPHLGVFNGYILADVPGIIEGASAGKGLGLKFLKHITRIKKIIHLISLENEDTLKAYKIIKEELGKYSEDLTKKEELIVLTKTDLVDKERIDKEIKKIGKTNVTAISVLDDKSMQEFSKMLSQLLI